MSALAEALFDSSSALRALGPKIGPDQDQKPTDDSEKRSEKRTRICAPLPLPERKSDETPNCNPEREVESVGKAVHPQQSLSQRQSR